MLDFCGFYSVFTYFCAMDTKKEDLLEKAVLYYRSGYACSQALVLTFADELNYDASTALAMAAGFGGGMGRLRRTCGAVTGAFMVLGLQYGAMSVPDNEQKLQVYRQVRECNKRFEALHGSSVCKELLTQAAKAKERKEARHVCDHCVRDATAIVYDMIQERPILP